MKRRKNNMTRLFAQMDWANRRLARELALIDEEVVAILKKIHKGGI